MNFFELPFMYSSYKKTASQVKCGQPRRISIAAQRLSLVTLCACYMRQVFWLWGISYLRFLA